MQPFSDFGFKLVVLQELLETGSFAAELKSLKEDPLIARRLSGEEAYGELVPEMEQFFRNATFSESDLTSVREICFDGGHDIYHLIRPFWSGESDEFDVLSVDGFETLTNLERVVYCSMISDHELARFEKAGISVE